jgi:hypothetical protein
MATSAVTPEKICGCCWHPFDGLLWAFEQVHYDVAHSQCCKCKREIEVRRLRDLTKEVPSE